jgi:CspA family cold shock protein
VDGGQWLKTGDFFTIFALQLEMFVIRLRCFYTHYGLFGGSSKMKGTVKWFNNQTGYGYNSDAGGNDVFVHFSGLNMDGFKTLDEGETVSYDVIDGPKGPQAVNVERA